MTDLAPPHEHDRETLRRMLNGLGVASALRLDCEALGAGTARVAMALPLELLGPGGRVPFAFVYGLADAAASFALHTVVSPEDLHVTTDLGLQLVGPAEVVGPLVAEAEVVRRARRVAFAEARISDAGGELCALASGTWAVVPDSPASIARRRATAAG